ncbi:Retrovirus-related Pol polyprotein, partial [Mucuna pruriens]
MQIHITPKDQHKTTFTCPFGTFAYTRMPFGLWNAPSTFQCCITSIFSDLLLDCMEVFMDDFTVYADSFDACLDNLSKLLTRCIDTNLVLNYEKCHFIVTEGIVSGHLVSNRGIEVDKSKIDVITSLPNPIYVREKDVEFKFDQPYIEAFQELKNLLTSAPILQVPNWDLPFELMCDASNLTLGAVLGQRAGVGKPMHVIAYASRMIDLAQLNYTTTEKELLAIVFALDKFRSYLLGSKIILLHITTPTPWFADICNFVATSQFPPEASRLYKEKLQSDAKYYIWDDPYLWRLCSDQIIRRCIPKAKINSVLQLCHAAPGGGHYSTQTARKVLDYGLYWPTIFRNAYQFASTCDKCKKIGMEITRRHEMLQ